MHLGKISFSPDHILHLASEEKTKMRNTIFQRLDKYYGANNDDD